MYPRTHARTDARERAIKNKIFIIVLGSIVCKLLASVALLKARNKDLLHDIHYAKAEYTPFMYALFDHSWPHNTD